MTELSTSNRPETASAAGTRGLDRVRALDPVHAASAVVGLVVAVFLLHQLTAWPPHEDESLALLVGRDSLGGVVSHVTRDRGGAPLHFLFAWAVAHVGLGLGGLRVVSASFAVASIPLIGLLARRLAGAPAAVGTVVLAGGSWLLLFHGIYGRMYSLFLALSVLSCLALLIALDGGGRRAWLAWLAVTVLCVASHPYGALVVASEALASPAAPAGSLAPDRRLVRRARRGRDPVLAHGHRPRGPLRRRRRRGWREARRPGRRARLPLRGAGDMTAGWTWILAPVLLVAGVGLVVAPRDAQRLSAAFLAVPPLAFLAARLGQRRGARVTAPHLRPAVLPALRRARRALARPRDRSGSGGRPGGARRRRGRVGVAPDDAALRVGAVGAPGGARSGQRLSRSHEPAGRPAPRLRPALPRRVGARPRPADDGAAARRPGADAEAPPPRAEAARTRRLGARRERQHEPVPAADDRAPPAASRGGVHGPDVRPVPRDPHT